MNLLHDPVYFEKNEILRRADVFEFPNPLAVELFLWDCEIASQLQKLSDVIILKGGAAAQLHLPVEMQRGSIDVDVVARFNDEEVLEIISDLSQSLGDAVSIRLHEPKDPAQNIPMKTFFMSVPTVLELHDRDALEIKIDFLMEDLDLPTIQLEKIPTFALDVEKITCFTRGVMIGDKILTLAKESVGLTLISDYPKQIYDVDNLISYNELSEEDVNHIIKSIKEHTILELGYRSIDASLSEVLTHIISTMDEYASVDTSRGEDNIKNNIDGFQQFYVKKSQRKPHYGWSIKCLKIKFLVKLISVHLDDQLTIVDICDFFNRSVKSSNKLGQITGDLIKKYRDNLLEMAEGYISYFKELRGKSLERVFWQVLTLNNLEKIESLLDSRAHPSIR